MKKTLSKKLKYSLIVYLLLFPIIVFSGTGKHDCIITNVNVVDINNGEILKNKFVVIDSNRISAIYDTEIVSSGSTLVIDGKGKIGRAHV